MEALYKIIDILIPLVVAFAVPFIAIMFKKYIGVLEKKTEISFSKEEKEQFDEVLYKAIAYAEEQARKAVKGGATLTGDEKMVKAVEFVKNEVKNNNMSMKIDEDSIKKQLESAIYNSLHNDTIYK